MNTILHYDVKNTPWPFEDQSFQTVVTSPPYWRKRDYGRPEQLGQEKTPEEYTQKLVEVFREVRRVLKDDGVLWLNLGDTYYGGKGQNGASVAYSNHTNALNKAALTTSKSSARPQDMPIDGLKKKDIVGIPWMVAFALRADGWYLRQDIIWSKPNPMPESVTDRCTASHEYIFMLTKNQVTIYLLNPKLSTF